MLYQTPYNMKRAYGIFVVCKSPVGTTHFVATDFNPLGLINKQISIRWDCKINIDNGLKSVENENEIFIIGISMSFILEKSCFFL